MSEFPSLSEQHRRILRYIETGSEQITLKTSVIAFNLDMSEEVVAACLDDLRSEGLVRIIDTNPDVYRISPIGSRFREQAETDPD